MRALTFTLIALVCAPSALGKSKAEPIEKTYAKELQLVADKTRDPNAVQFRKLHAGADGAICGELNAKNAFGGYVGFKSFFVKGDQVVIVTDEGREQRKDLSDAQWAWERQLDQKEFVNACGS